MFILERCPSYGMSVLRGFTVYGFCYNLQEEQLTMVDVCQLDCKPCESNLIPTDIALEWIDPIKVPFEGMVLFTNFV